MQFMVLFFSHFQENFEKDRNIVIGETTIKQTVYIYNCKESTIVIKGKINGVILGKSLDMATCSCWAKFELY